MNLPLINMKTSLLCSIIFWAALPLPAVAEGGVPDYGNYATLLERYVTPDGVRYEQWHSTEEDSRLLDEVLVDFSRVDYQSLPPDEATAFLTNLYNAAMIRAVLDHYPLDSVRSIGILPFSIFRRNWIALNGDKVSLDTIEKEILLKEFGDPRIHFAVNCASESCPPLRAEPFTGARLEDQFQEQTLLFANSSRAARVSANGDSTAYSELFQWYADDFPGDDPALYLNRYRSDPLPIGNQVKWIDYDWSLNEAGE